MNQPNVTLIIPIYNVATYIADCLRSVYTQTYPSLEVILVNDATPDDSMTLAVPWIEKLQERYEVKVVNHTWNRGLSAARNTGMEVATADWIYFMDSDDEITPNCIELLAAQIEKYPDVDFVIGSVKIVGSTWDFPLTCKTYVKGNENILRDYTTYKWYVMAVNHLYRKNYLQKNKLVFKEGLLHEDVLFSFQVAATAQAMAVVFEETYLYKIRTTGSITAQLKLKNFEDLLYINEEKFAYILKQYQAKVHTIPYTYGLNMLYEYAFLLVKSKQIRQTDRICLFTDLLKAFLPLRTYRNEALNLKYRVWSIVIRMPIGFILWITWCGMHILTRKHKRTK